MTNNNIIISKERLIIKKVILYFSFLVPILAIIFHNTNITKEIVGGLGGNIALYSLLIIVFTSPIHILINNSFTKFFMDIRPELGTFMGITAVTHGMFAINGIYAFLGVILPPLSISGTDNIKNIIINNFDILALYAGFIAMLISFVLLITSNKLSINKLGVWWFRIHKAIIFIVILGVFHGSFIKGGLLNRHGGIAWDSIIEFSSWIILYFVLKYFANKKKSNAMLNQNNNNQNNNAKQK